MTKVDIILPRKHFDLVIKEEFADGITGIFGPSGAGKTSLLHAIAGLAKPKAGSISIGKQVQFDASKGIHLPVEQRNIGYVFQEGRLFPHMTVEKNLLYGHKKKGDNKIAFEEVIKLLKLDHLLAAKPSQISGGERQRTALGRSLLSSPEILLLDEPFSAVDTQLRKQILPFIIQIQQQFNIPILVVSHDLPDLLRLTQTLCVVQQGKCIGHGPYYDLLKQESIADIFGTSSLVNSIEVSVQQSKLAPFSNILVWKEGDREIHIKCEQNKSKYEIGLPLRLFLHADDIALSLAPVEQVSIQNQLEGTIEDIIERDHARLCIVNVGFPLVVKITAASQQRMGLQTGNKVWCLFKSVAIDAVG